MSDAKAKAEARRARILGKEGSRLALAKGDISSLTPSSDTTAAGEDETSEPKIETTPHRPLAARRNLVKTDTSSSTPRSTELSEQEKTEDPGSNTIDSFKAKVGESTLTPKIVREIENEIAANTIKFDKDQLAEQAPTESDSLVSSNSSSNGRISKKSSASSESKSTSEVSTVKILKRKPIISSPVQAFQVMQIIRILGIVSLASFTAYRSVTQSGITSSSSPLVSGSINADGSQRLDKLDEFLNAPDAATEPIFDYTIPSDLESFSFSQALASPLQWMKNRVVRQTESTLSAVGLVWWITSMMSTMISRLFPYKPKSSSGGLMGMVMTVYNEGMQVVYEYGFKTVGEICLHFFTLIATVLLLGYYYESLSATSSSTTEASNVKAEL